MVWQVYLEIEKNDGKNTFVSLEALHKGLNMEMPLALEYIRSLQILEYADFDESNNCVRLLK